jgi:hypothetical protein
MTATGGNRSFDLAKREDEGGVPGRFRRARLDRQWLENLLRNPHIWSEIPNPKPAMKTSRTGAAPAHLGFLLDELRLAGVTTYAGLAAALNRQGIRPARGRWTARALHLAMRRHRHAHPSASLNIGPALTARRAEEARRVIRRLRRRGLKTQGLIARALNARGLTTPGYGRQWTARSVSRVLARRPRRRKAKATLH